MPRYVVVVWWFDAWAINVQTDDRGEAERAARGARDHGHRALFIDTAHAHFEGSDVHSV